MATYQQCTKLPGQAEQKSIFSLLSSCCASELQTEETDCSLEAQRKCSGRHGLHSTESDRRGPRVSHIAIYAASQKAMRRKSPSNVTELVEDFQAALELPPAPDKDRFCYGQLDVSDDFDTAHDSDQSGLKSGVADSQVLPIADLGEPCFLCGTLNTVLSHQIYSDPPEDFTLQSSNWLRRGFEEREEDERE